MTLDEKIGQLNLVTNNPLFDRTEVSGGHVGGVLAFASARDIAAIQAVARRSRLGIPLLVGLDVLHGTRTMFPMPLAEAASFDPDLARLNATLAAREASAVGINWTFAPMADLARDPRWGRTIEGFGEDPHLGRLFTRARVEGFQAGGLAATLKHFAGYGAARGGRDYDAADIALPDLLDSYVPPFRAGIEAGAGSVMSGFHALNGEPASASRGLLTGTLRDRLGFDGFVVSDWTAIAELIPHGVAASPAEAARKALAAGIDMDMASGLYRAHLRPELEAGRVDEASITEATRRVLRTKVRMGLLDRPAVDPASAAASADIPAPTAATREAARRAARDATVLLRNEGALPLAPGARIALVGGMAGSNRDGIGPHAALVRWEDGVTVLDGLKRRAERTGATVAYAAGCEAACESEAGFDEAVAAARSSDVVVAVMGESVELTGEGGSRAYLTLPGRQPELLRRLVETGRPVVLVLMASRPIELGPLHDRLAALMMAWFPGTEGGNALADLLFGDVSPSAKLPLTWPRTVGQVPLTYDRRPSGRPHDPNNVFTLRYADERVSPLYPFGFGLTYTRFALSNLAVATPRVARDGVLEVQVRLANYGLVEGREVVQLYVRQPVASVSRPLRQLKAFEKVSVGRGDSRLLTFRVPAAELGFHREDGSYVVEPGPFHVFVGSSSDAPLWGTFEVLP